MGPDQNFGAQVTDQALALFTATANRLEAKLDEGLGEMRREIGKLSRQTAGIQNTVDLMVAGKIRLNGNSGQQPPTAPAVSLRWVIELGKLAGAFLAGFWGGKGGSA